MSNKSCSYYPESKPPLILSGPKWTSILDQLHQNEKVAEQNRNEKVYLEYLQRGSREMKKHWANTLNQVNRTEFYNRKNKDKEKAIQDKLVYLQIKQNDEKIRQEKIAQAKHMIHRLEPGPRELESASMLSEILKSRQIQLDIQNDMKQSQIEHEICNNENFARQKIPWIGEEHDRIELRRNRKNEYKNDLKICIRQQEQNKIDCAKSLTAGEKSIREHMLSEFKRQKEYEADFSRYKKDQMRQSAMEALEMAKQKRHREKLEHQVDDKINAICMEGKQQIEDLRRLKQKEILLDKMKSADENVKNLMRLQSLTLRDDENEYLTVAKEKNDRFEALELEKHQNKLAFIAERKKYFMDEFDKKRENDAQKLDEMKWMVANRLKNVEVNHSFARTQIEYDFKKATELRTSLLKQIEERKAEVAIEKAIGKNCCLVDNHEKDTFFFDYGKRLLDNATEKQRPILPIIKAIEKYKKENSLNIRKPVPPHLVSDVPIGEFQIRANGCQPVSNDSFK